MKKNQEGNLPRSSLKDTALGKELFEKYTPKKDLSRKAADYHRKTRYCKNN